MTTKPKLPKKNYDAPFKAKVALDALSQLHTADAVAKKYGVNKTQVNLWRNIIRDQAVTLFVKGKADVYDDKQSIIDEQQQVIGQLTMELSQLKKKLR